VIAKSDKRAKLVKAERSRSAEYAATSTCRSRRSRSRRPSRRRRRRRRQARRPAGKLGSKAELEKLSVTELKQLAADHGVTVERGDTKPKLAAKLAKVEPARRREAATSRARIRARRTTSRRRPSQPDTPPDE
jgi:hypothetical protein